MKKPSAVRIANRWQRSMGKDELINQGYEEYLDEREYEGLRPTHVVVGKNFYSSFEPSPQLKAKFKQITGLDADADWRTGVRHHPVLVKLIQQMGKKAGDYHLVPLRGKQYLITEQEGESVVFDKDKDKWGKILAGKIVMNYRYGGFGLSPQALSLYEAETNQKNVWDLNINRTDQMLVLIVENLGKDSWGRSARLIVERVSGSMYHVAEYDGLEKLYTNKDLIRI